MTDRELLELAAKAAGIEILYWAYERLHLMDGSRWEPLDDGNDSQDLQARIVCDVSMHEKWINVAQFKNIIGSATFAPETYYNGTLEDRLRALREAIFKLAVEIGRGMKC